jgi:hypothetical protein
MELRTHRALVEETRSSMQANCSRGRVLDSLMEQKRLGHLPGIFGRLVSVWHQLSSYHNFLWWVPFPMPLHYAHCFLPENGVKDIVTQFDRWMFQVSWKGSKFLFVIGRFRSYWSEIWCGHIHCMWPSRQHRGGYSGHWTAVHWVPQEEWHWESHIHCSGETRTFASEVQNTY